MGAIYAFVEYGSYEDYGFRFIRIKSSDRGKLRDLSKDSKGWGYSEHFDILAWSEELELEGSDSVELLTIQEFQLKINDDLQRLLRMKETHYLYGNEDKFRKLLAYKFLEV